MFPERLDEAIDPDNPVRVVDTDLLVRQRTQLINALRAHLAEIGLVAATGVDGLESLIDIVRDADETGRLAL